MENHSILVVDDEPDNFEVIETLLANDNYRVYYASSGEDALNGIETFNPDVILLDLMMPGMDGLELCQRLRLMRKWRSVPILMVTAAAGKSVLAQCLESGADDFVNKPVDGLELRARVKSAIRTKKQFDRIESLSKLQQHSITSLENDLGELIGDLAMGFVSEFSTPLTSIQEQLGELNDNFERFSSTQVRYLICGANKSALDIQKNTYKFWTYLDFAGEKKSAHADRRCNIKELIESIAIVQAQWLNREPDLVLKLEPAQVAITEKHCELIVKELLDNAFKFSESSTKIRICGEVIDQYFQLSISDGRSDAPLDRPNTLLEPELQELGLSLKVVKKIVDLYDGAFSTITNDRNETIVWISLPLV